MRLQEAARSLARKDVGGALSRLRQVLRYPSICSRENLAVALKQMSEACHQLQQPEAAAAVAYPATRLHDADALRDAARSLIRHRHPDIAAGILYYAVHWLSVPDEAWSDLATCLEQLHNPEDAAALLKNSGAAERSIECRYQLGLHRAMSGDLEGLRSLLPSFLDTPHPEAPAWHGRLAAILTRADALAQHRERTDSGTEVDAAWWHFVLNGCLMLHAAPESQGGTLGRYCMHGDQPALVRTGIHRLGKVLQSVDLTPPRVLALPDRSSGILASAVGQLLGKPVEPWSDAAPDQPGLVVAYDLERVDPSIRERLAHHHPNQWLYAHAACWTKPTEFAPDFVTLVYQRLTAPWDAAGVRIIPELMAAFPVPDNQIPIPKFIQSIVGADLSTVASHNAEDTLLALVRGAATFEDAAAVGMFRKSGRRAEVRWASPVKSNRFLL